MYPRLKGIGVRCFLAIACLGACSWAAGQSSRPATATIRRVAVLNPGNNFELEIEASQPVTPRTLVVTGPDRLVIDFPNAIPGPLLHTIAVRAGQVKAVRMGLFESNPPVARVVVDLNSPQAYEVFPSGKNVIVKIRSGSTVAAASLPAPGSVAPAVVASSPPLPPPAPVKPAPAVQVEFSNGKLRVLTEKASLGEVLRAIGQQTGATISIPPRAEQEPVVANLGPAPAREVLSALLDGLPYNVILMGSGRDLSQVTSIILTTRDSATPDMPANYAPQPVQEATPEPEPPPPPVEPENPPPPAPDAVPPPPQ